MNYEVSGGGECWLYSCMPWNTHTNVLHSCRLGAKALQMAAREASEGMGGQSTMLCGGPR